MPKLALVAIGGNSLITDPKHPDIPHQWDAVRETCRQLADMVEAGWQLVLTHGNGPQVGFILRRNEIALPQVHSTPLDLIVADTQGSIGYMIQQALKNELYSRGMRRNVLTIVTQVLVKQDDPAFQNPTKPIGGFMDLEGAERFREQGYTVVEDAGRGYRRVVASPKPLRVIEEESISELAYDGTIVIAAGGGGIPVIHNHAGELRQMQGVPAVIDKDRVSSLLARRIDADLFLISTGVEQVATHFGTEQQTAIGRISAADTRRLIPEGHFAPGSMLPKIEAALDFVEETTNAAVITNPANLFRAINGETGTHIEANRSA